MTNEETAVVGPDRYTGSGTGDLTSTARAEASAADVQRAHHRAFPLALNLRTVRAGIALLGAQAALAAWFLLAPSAPVAERAEASSHSSLVSAVRSDQSANELTADSSPQQTVVNTWATVDMLEVVTTQLDDLAEQLAAAAPTAPASDGRIPGLLLIGILVFCLSRVAELFFDGRPSAA